jgi:hypothetical protein
MCVCVPLKLCWARLVGVSAISAHMLVSYDAIANYRDDRIPFFVSTVTVTRLIRISYGDYQLQTIPPGMAIEVPVKPVANQRRRGKPPALRNSRRADATVAKPEVRQPKAETSRKIQWVRNARF